MPSLQRKRLRGVPLLAVERRRPGMQRLQRNRLHAVPWVRGRRHGCAPAGEAPEMRRGVIRRVPMVSSSGLAALDPAFSIILARRLLLCMIIVPAL